MEAIHRARMRGLVRKSTWRLHDRLTRMTRRGEHRRQPRRNVNGWIAGTEHHCFPLPPIVLRQTLGPFYLIGESTTCDQSADYHRLVQRSNIVLQLCAYVHQPCSGAHLSPVVLNTFITTRLRRNSTVIEPDVILYSKYNLKKLPVTKIQIKNEIYI